MATTDLPGAALDQARELLAGHSYIPGVAQIIDAITKLRPDTEDDDGIEKAMRELDGAERIAKAANLGDDERRVVLASIAKSRRPVEHEMQMGRSVGYRRAQEQIRKEAAQRAANLGRAA